MCVLTVLAAAAGLCSAADFGAFFGTDFDYLYEGDGPLVGAGTPRPAVRIDGTWARATGSDEWDGLGLGAAIGAPGGMDIIDLGEGNSALRIVDQGDPRDLVPPYADPCNRKLASGHDCATELGAAYTDALVDDGVTLVFRVRMLDNSALDPFDQPNPNPVGYQFQSSGKGPIYIASRNAGPANDINRTLNFTIWNGNLLGASTGRQTAQIVIPLADVTQWTTVWASCAMAESGKHLVRVWINDSFTPVFEGEVTLPTSTEDLRLPDDTANYAPDNYLCIEMEQTDDGADATYGRGAMDIDYIGYKAGTSSPWHSPGFDYTYDGDAPLIGAGTPRSAVRLDGKWRRLSGSDEWDGSGLGNAVGAPGGMEIVDLGGGDSALRIVDQGDPRDLVPPFADPSNRKLASGHDCATELGAFTDSLLDTGVTFVFKTRVLDNSSLDPFDQPNPNPLGYQFQQYGNKGPIYFGSRNAGPANDVNRTLNFTIWNGRLLGAGTGYQTGQIDIPLSDVTAWTTVWATCALAPSGKHLVTVWVNGSDAPAFQGEVTLPTATEDLRLADDTAGYSADNYLCLELEQTDSADPTFGRGAIDVDYISYKAGVFTPVFVNATPVIALAPAGPVELELCGASVSQAFIATISDPDAGQALTVAWAVAPDASIAVGDPATNATVTFSAAGEYDVTATVSDGEDSVSATAHVTVVECPNTPPTIALDPAGPVELELCDVTASQTFVATVTDPDVGQTLNVAWSDVPGATVTVGDPPTSAIVTFSATGEYDVAATVFDGFAAVSTTAHVSVVECPNTPPTISIDPAGPVSLELCGVEVSQTFVATVADPDAGQTLSVAWSDVPGAVITVGDPATTAVVTFSAIGEYNVAATVFDGVESVTATAHVTVAECPNTPPTISIDPAGPLSFELCDAAVSQTFTATIADDDEGQTLTVAWADVPGATVAVGDPPTSAVVTFTAAGEYDIGATVTDGIATVGTAVHVTVAACSGVPVYVGDANCSKALDIADAICILGYLFGPETDACKSPCCQAQMDTNDSNVVDIADAIRLLSYLFASGDMLAPDGSTITAASGSGCNLYPQPSVTLPCAQSCAE
ncbi:MAG TPA: hypothetical protein DCM87_20060 [Planctomycetes bacterium]|nr:hypothetical protein [Planctomycetota bacterium]